MNRVLLVLAGLAMLAETSWGQSGGMPAESQRALINQYCAGCHNEDLKSGGFSWSELDVRRPDQSAERAEKVIRKVRSGMMPPAGARRPDAATLNYFAAALETGIDQAHERQPYIKGPELHRVNRTEYRNSVRDLLGIDVDVSSLLPPDARSGGFDNMSDALTVTPALMQGYLRAADKISRLAVGDPQSSPVVTYYNVPKVVNQMRHVEGTPFGTRGGISVPHIFPADAEYTFRVDPHFKYTGTLFGTSLPNSLKDQQIEVSIDGARVALFTLDPQMYETQNDVEEDSALITPRIQVKAGQRRLSAAFLSKYDGPEQDLYRLAEQTLADPLAGDQPGMTFLPHLKTFSVTGPFNPGGVAETASRRKIFTCRPANSSEEQSCATQVISRLATAAFRRPVNAEDLEWAMTFYQTGREEGDFETGIRTALQAILSHPEFVFRFEQAPANVQPGGTYRISDLELASRLAYFLWSSIPDDQLITVASQGKLKDPAVLEQQTRRMLADPRAEVLATHFAVQWLRLGSLNDVFPEPKVFRDFTRNLALSMRREVELLFDSVVREDRNVIDLLTADYTFVDEVLARHYGIPEVIGSRFQRVKLTDPTRFGLLGKAGILTMTSLSNRTSPVARGKYVLEVLIGSPPPPPLPVVPPLQEAVLNQENLSMRERMRGHRDNPACRACHQIMDPIGLALENFDGIGLWRDNDEGSRIDATGTMYDGSELDGPTSVRQAVLNRSDAFLGSFTESLLAYGVGRVLDYRDMPTVRSIAREAAKNNNRFSSFILGIVESPAFQMRKVHTTSVQ